MGRKGNYWIINKHDNQDWDQWASNRTAGEKLWVPLRWMFDNPRGAMYRLTKKGYFIAYTESGHDVFTRTSKPWVQGDSPKKPLNYSKQNNES